MASAVPKKKAAKKAPVMPRAGRTVEGVEYVTTHTCPSCMAVMLTVGAGYPQLVCSRCIMPMTSKHKKVGN